MSGESATAANASADGIMCHAAKAAVLAEALAEKPSRASGPQIQVTPLLLQFVIALAGAARISKRDLGDGVEKSIAGMRRVCCPATVRWAQSGPLILKMTFRQTNCGT